MITTKPTRILKIVEATLFVLLVVLTIFFKLENYWFTISLFYISLILIGRFLIFKSESNIYYALFLLIFSISIAVINYFNFDNFYIFVSILFSLCCASVSVYLFFRQSFHIKLVAIYFLEVLLLVIYRLGYIKLLDFTLVQSIYISFVLYAVMKRVKVNLRSK